jgi:hypothetical protein
MARKLVAIIPPPPKPVTEMTEEELRSWTQREYDEVIAPALRRAGVAPADESRPPQSND